MSTQATNTRLRITRAGITTAAGATEYLKSATHFAPGTWGFLDGSVLVFRIRIARSGDSERTAQQISRRIWAAYFPR